MNPAFSVIFLTTLIGMGQGLFIALVAGQPYSGDPPEWLAQYGLNFALLGSLIVLGLLGLGLLASFFHLGRPERAWRAITMWRTSWLSREVIVLPLAMMLVTGFALLQFRPEWASEPVRLVIGWSGVAVMLTLFVCTGMIYACIKFLQEWASPWTLVNFTLLGCASGLVLASALARTVEEPISTWFVLWAIGLTIFSMFTRIYSFYRNKNIKYKSTIQTAIGIRHQKISQRSMGMTGGSFNTRAFFHHCTDTTMRNMPFIVVALVFVAPILLLLGYVAIDRMELLWLAVAVQYVGLIGDRWLFFAQANHPQNIYYQTVS